MGTIDKYLLEAIDNYPYNLPEAIEALNYSLSYESENPIALCLMGQIYSEQLGQYEKAKSYFEEALQCDLHAIKIYPHYLNVLLWNDDLKEARKFIDYAFKVKGVDKGMLFYYSALIFEYEELYSEALKELKSGLKHCYNSGYIDFLKSQKERVKLKMKPLKQKKKKVKPKKKSKKKKKNK